MLYRTKLVGFLYFSGLAIIQKCETNATAPQQFSITEPSTMNK